MKPSKHRERRNAMTLTELLVVVAIIVILAAILLPMVQPILRGQKVREAARQLSVFITGAQARAVATGRPAGIWIERAAHEPTGTGTGDPRWYTSYRVIPAEQPEPYRGDMFDARVVIRPQGGDLWGAFYQDTLAPPGVEPMIPCCSLVWPSLQNGSPIVRPGDLIRFESRGPYYLIVNVDAEKFTFRAPPMLMGGAQMPNPEIVKLMKMPSPIPNELPSYHPGIRFEVLRRPIQSTGNALEMPRNTGIDLSVSGYPAPFQAPMAPLGMYTPERVAVADPNLAGPARFREISPEYDMVIMFSPSGGVDKVYYVSHEEPVYANFGDIQPTDLTPFWEVPHGNIDLMVARDDQIGRGLGGELPTNNFQTNAVANLFLGQSVLKDPNNIWISLSTTTGRVTSAPNSDAYTDPITGAVVPADTLTLQQYLDNARRFVKSGRSSGGR